MGFLFEGFIEKGVRIDYISRGMPSIFLARKPALYI